MPIRAAGCPNAGVQALVRGAVQGERRQKRPATVADCPAQQTKVDRAAADAVLTGNGEIWVKGYQSLNARSGRMPYNGTPIYSGFLSVEVKDVKGETLWSYLASPGGGSANIAKRLAESVVKHLSEALEHSGEGR